jgi:fatty-acyl-CoA synthase
LTDTIQDLLRRRAEESRPALLFGDDQWSWREYVEESSRRAAALTSLRDPERPFHVGLLLDNTPEMAMGLAAAALGGYVVAGLNTTRRGEALARDARHADCQVVLTDAEHLPLLDGVDLGGARVLDVEGAEWKQLLASADPDDPPFQEVDPAALFMLIFTSGTSGEPKAVRVTHEKVVFPGAYLTQMFGLTSEDRFYLSMPLFHSNAVMAGWGPGVTCGAAMALAPRFSASRFIDDIRRYGVTYMNYVGKPLAYVLATPPRPDDADNPLRIAFGNEASDKDIEAFAERFGCWVQDGFGSTENAVVISRVPGTPPGSLGRPLEGVKVLDPDTGEECPPARFGADGEVLNLDEAVGELVNTTGAGQFAGYYKDDAATAARMRGGMYWSGDLAYRDEDGWVYFAGRTSDWLRVDGENLAAAPIERLLLRHRDVNRVAVYAVPDEMVGDQVMAALVLRDGSGFEPAEFERFLDSQPDLGTKMRPRYIRVAPELPSTATNKILKRELVRQGVDGAGDPVWERDPRGTSYTRR